MQNIKNSTDVWFCAFLMHKGYKIQSYKIIARGKVACDFNMTDEEWQKLKLEYNNSDISSYKALIEKIKDLAF